MAGRPKQPPMPWRRSEREREREFAYAALPDSACCRLTRVQTKDYIVKNGIALDSTYGGDA